DDLPTYGTEINGAAQSQSRIGGRGVLTDDEFGKTGLEHAAFYNFDIAANGKDVGRDATKLNVGVGTGGTQWNRGHQDSFGCEQRSVGAASDSGSILDNFHGIESDSTGHFGGGAGAGNKRVVLGAGRNKSSSEAAGERQH